VASCAEVAAFNKLFKAVNSRRGGELGVVEATWTNVALSASGLAALGLPRADLAALPAAFREGMAARAELLGDIGPNAPENWVAPLGSEAVHALVLLAADDLDDLDEAAWSETNRLLDHGLRILFIQEGRARSDLPGHEHFGFKDASSQRQDLLSPTDFVLGHSSDAALPWTADGSFLAFRRLRQDVAAFARFVGRTGAASPLTEHIRAVAPRETAPACRILRRGIAYGEPYDPGAPAGSTRAADVAFPHDRGLLFLSYQASIERQFEEVQRLWAESSLRSFVVMTGGEYFFAPSLSALVHLGKPRQLPQDAEEGARQPLRRRHARVRRSSARALPLRPGGLRPARPSRASARQRRGRPGSRARRGGAR
jgi:deferrochelatase/peroxidase EfeB